MTFKGTIEAQGNYNDILTSGIDIGDMLIEKEEIEDSQQIADDGNDETKLISRKSSSSSLRKSTNSIQSLNETRKSIAEKDREGTDGKDGMLKELEASSRGKVSGSLLFNYLKSANQSCTLAFLIVAFLLTQILCCAADIWISHW